MWVEYKATKHQRVHRGYLRDDFEVEGVLAVERAIQLFRERVLPPRRHIVVVLSHKETSGIWGFSSLQVQTFT